MPAPILLLVSVLTACFVGCAAPENSHDPPHADARAATVSHESHAEEGVVELTAQQLDSAGIVLGEARLRSLEPEIQTTGEVDYEQNRVAHVGPRISGRLVHVVAELGDPVRRGDVLAVIDSVELGEARSRHMAAASHEKLSRRTFERERTLFEQQITSEQKMQEAESAYLEATALREGTEQTLRLYGVDPDRISRRADESSEDYGTGEDAPSRLEVKAPIDGRVVEKHATLGEMVTPSDALFTLADLSRVWVWIDVFERDLASVHEDDGVEVSVDSFPGRSFVGKVSYLAPEVEPETRTVRARIDVPNAERLLRPGMFADVRLSDPHGQSEAPALAIPESALVRGDDATVFRPVGDGRFRAVSIQVGRRQSGWVEVVDGLEAGDAVVVEGAFLLKSELARSELGGGHSH